MKVKCGESPHNIGYIQAGSYVRKMHMLLRDRKTGKTRRHFFDVATASEKGRAGGFSERLSVKNVRSKHEGGMPIALYMPGEFGSSWWAKSIRNILPGTDERNVLNELKKEEELSWIKNSADGKIYETLWRPSVPGIKADEDVLDIRYELDADIPFMTDLQFKNSQTSPIKNTRNLSTLKALSTKTTVDEFYCKTYEEQISFNCKITKEKYCISPTGGWCQAPNGREAVYLSLIACHTKDSTCPSITDCVFSEEKSIYFNAELRKRIITKNWIRASETKPDHSTENNNTSYQDTGGAGQ